MVENGIGTSHIQMLAQGVVEQQAKYCSAKMENVEGKIDSLARQVEALAQTVESLRSTQAALKVDIAVQKTKIAIWAALGGSVPALVMLLLDFVK